MRHLLLAMAVLTPSVVSAQTVVNQIKHNGSFAGGCAYDSINDRVWVFDDPIRAYDRSSGTELAAMSSPVTNPIGGFVDPATGNLWVGSEAEVVFEMDQGGVVHSSFSTLPTVGDVSALTWDPATDTLWVLDDTALAMYEFTKNGVFTGRSIGVSALANDPDGLAFNPVSRTFFIANDLFANLIIETDFSGTLLNSWFAPDPPEGLDCDKSGSLFMAFNFGTSVPAGVLELTGITLPGSVTLFCTAKTALFCGAANISAAGASSATAASGFVIKAQPVRGCRAGLLLYSNQSAQNGVPFGGQGDGVLCLASGGLRRAGPIESGGTSPQTCDGALAIDMNRFRALNWSATGCNPASGQNQPAGFLGNMGTVVNAQMWGRDSTMTGQVLSDGMSWSIGP